MGIKKNISDYMVKHRPFWFFSILGRLPFASDIMKGLYYTNFPGPRSIKIHITNKCNYRCLYCYSSRYEEKAISIPEWLGVIDELSSYDVQTLEISGGEPFLEKGVFDILKKCADKNYQVTIYTNGSLINKDIIKKLKPYKNQIIISVKYDSPENYSEKTKGRYELEKIENNIRLLIRNKIPVIAFITVTKDNFRDMKKIINKSIDLGAFPVVERYMGVKDSKTNKKLSIKSEEWKEAIKMIMKVYSNYRLLIDGISRIQGATCSCYKTQASIMQGGEVLPCQFLPLSMSIGNIKKESFHDIWKKIERKRKEWNKIPKECNNCKSKEICGGGCRTESYYTNSTFLRKDSLCCSNIPTTYGHSASAVIHSFKPYDNINNKKLNKLHQNN